MKPAANIEILKPKREFSEQNFEVAEILSTTTKVRERITKSRKSLIDVPGFVAMVNKWVNERPPLHATNQDIKILALFFLGEIEEILEHRELEGLPEYDFKSETGETMDAGFFLASLSALLESKNTSVDYGKALSMANGQASGSKSLELLKDVGGNIQEKTLSKDLQYLWTIWISYIIHMKYSVNPTQVLREYTFPKNNANYPTELLRGNPLFQRTFNREMHHEERLTYFSHFRKAMRLIRDFTIKYVDPKIEHSGLKPEHYSPYKVFIYSFMNFSSVGLSPENALKLLEEQLYKDHKIIKTPQTPTILRANTKLPN